MPIDSLSNLTRRIRTSVLVREVEGFTDAQLLTFYVERREEAAIAVLLRRHGPMVWNVCRRLLANNCDAEDAFQATFLILVRKAADVAPRDLVGNWLYGVAYRTALKARAVAARRGAREKQVSELPEPAAEPSDDGRDLRHLLDQELNRLPHLYRVPIVLCDLDGMTRDEAAARVGCPPGTLASRHARARSMLAKRLARHGFAVSGAVLAALFQGTVASAGLPTTLAASTLAAAGEFTAGPAAAGVLVSREVATLADSLLQTTLTAKLKIAVALVFAMSVVGAGVAVGMHPSALPADATALGQVEEPAFAGDANSPKAESPEPIESTPEPPAVDESKPEPPDQPLVVPAAPGLLRTIRHGGEVRALLFSHDGRYLVTGGENRVARVWETATGKPLAGPLKHDGMVMAAAISPDDKTVVTASADGTARLWDAATGKPLGRVMRQQGPVYAVALSGDGKYVATGGGDSSAHLWDATSGLPVGAPLRHSAVVSDVTFLPDGKKLVVSSWDGVVRKWDVATRKTLGPFLAQRCGITSMSIGRDGRVVLTGSRDRGGRLWDVATGTAISVPIREDGYFSNVALSPDGKTFLTGVFIKRGADALEPATVQLWDTATVRPIGPPFDRQDGLAFHPDGKICATSGQGVVRLWDIQSRLASARRGLAVTAPPDLSEPRR
jgi:RNA polymerase sigma factor (sigma-70 family)